MTFSEPSDVRPVLNRTRQNYPDTALQRINVPFDMNAGVAKPILDYDVISQLDAESLPAGWRYLPDLEGFIDGPLSGRANHYWVEDQEQWLQEMLQQSQKTRQHMADHWAAGAYGAVVYPGT
jgi:alkaline phosphatase D